MKSGVRMMLQLLRRAPKLLPLTFIRSVAAICPQKTCNSDNFPKSNRKEVDLVTQNPPNIGEGFQVHKRSNAASSPKFTFEYGMNCAEIHGSGRIQVKLGNRNCNMLLPNLWLRDNCRCKKCVNSDTMQRAFDTFSIPENIVPENVASEKEGFRVTWPDDDESHVSFYTWSWIMKNVLNCQQQQQKQKITFWGSEIELKEPCVEYDEVMASDLGVGNWTNKIRDFGFCFVDGCPISAKKTKELIERISFIRETHYGGFYDFTSDLMMKDTAYTNLALAPHTDTTYFTDPAGLQMFHLLSYEQGNGGSSILIDGFKAANILKSESREYYDILSNKPVHAHTVGNEGITIKPAKNFPVLGLRNPNLGKEGPELYQIRWNNDDRGLIPLENDHLDVVDMWYAAARRFNDILKMGSMQYKFQLKPGRPLIIDNWRVLHGRTAFTGHRRICGAYVTHDDYMSRWRNTNFTRQQLLNDLL